MLQVHPLTNTLYAAAHSIFRSKVAALGDGLSTLALSMTRAGGQPTTAAASLPITLLWPLCTSACVASLECFRLAGLLGERLQRGTAFWLCAGLAFTFQVGSALLHRCAGAMLREASEVVRRPWWQAPLLQISTVLNGLQLAA
ncbi:hypothetical protein ABPG77_011092 [Micractinium sp. CCAP 211/92]